MNDKKILLQLNGASFKYGVSDYLFEDLKLTIKEHDKIAIVGINGAGKSTLLKILAGKIALEQGQHAMHYSPYYVPQVDLNIHQKNLKLYEYLAEAYENWWEVLTEMELLFGTSLDSEQEMATLSGGEIMKLNLALALKHNPDVLLMDEPTNHLDIKSVETLINFLKNTKCAYVIISHDTFFLDQVVTTVIELENKKATTYGGNYSFYKEQKALHLRGIKKQHELALEKLEHANELAEKKQERDAKKANEMKRAFIKGSVNSREWGNAKNAATSSQGAIANKLEKLAEEAQESVEEFETEDRKLAFIALKNTGQSVGKSIVSIEKADLVVKQKVLVKNILLQVNYGDRIVISGKNGCGKTSLLKALISKDSTKDSNKNENIVLQNGTVTKNNNLYIVYIDQNYSLINPNLTLVQNVMNYHNSITESKAKEQLGKFHFKTDAEQNKLGSQLSGGEMVRVMMAMITSWPVDLVILDEPTNNLDVATVEVLVKALNLFRGALIVISHNMDFLNNINIKSAYIINNQTLSVMKNLPSNKQGYYDELVRSLE